MGSYCCSPSSPCLCQGAFPLSSLGAGVPLSAHGEAACGLAPGRGAAQVEPWLSRVVWKVGRRAVRQRVLVSRCWALPLQTGHTSFMNIRFEAISGFQLLSHDFPVVCSFLLGPGSLPSALGLAAVWLIVGKLRQLSCVFELMPVLCRHPPRDRGRAAACHLRAGLPQPVQSSWDLEGQRLPALTKVFLAARWP